jgi:hypothetical protein
MTTKRSSKKDEAPDVVVLSDAPASENPGDELVEMFHPETPGTETSYVTRNAYRETWAAKGWRIVKGREIDDENRPVLVLEPALPEDEIGVPEEGVVPQDSTTVEGEADASSSAGSDAGSSR